MTTASARVDFPDASGAVRMMLAGLAEALRHARASGDSAPAAAVVARCLADLGVMIPRSEGYIDLAAARDDWLRRLTSSRRSASSVTAYRVAIDDLVAWMTTTGRERVAFREETVVEYLHDYRERRQPAPATTGASRCCVGSIGGLRHARGWPTRSSNWIRPRSRAKRPTG